MSDDDTEPTDEQERALRILVLKWAVKEQAERLARTTGRLVRLLALEAVAPEEPCGSCGEVWKSPACCYWWDGNAGKDATACTDERIDTDTQGAALTGTALCHDFAPPPDATLRDEPPSKPL